MFMAPRDAVQRGVVRLALLAAVLVALAVAVVGPRVGGAPSLCDAKGKGPTPQAAMNSYLSQCGADYKVTKGPYDGEKRSSAYTSYYGEILEYTLRVSNNPEHSPLWVLVGQRAKEAPWTTLELGTGP